mmetsp:Transcript_19844/g.29732  ORF Transcript_19844/g.29732 Transcript_19844/m.29732 type:complete len:149 (+) Transcript_19844:203-649(+)
MFSYVFTFSILLAVMTNLCQYAYCNPPKIGRHGHKDSRPFILMLAATILLLLSPLQKLLVNLCMASFKENGYDATIGAILNLVYKPVFGERFMRLYTSLGYAFMILSTLLQIQVVPKIQAAMEKQRQEKARALALSIKKSKEEEATDC